MLGPELARAGFVWAAFIVLLGGLMLLVAEPGSAGFVISAVMVTAGVLFVLVIWVLIRLMRR